MRRGFKSHAELLSLTLRSRQRLRPHDRLDARIFVETFGIIVWTPAEIVGLASAYVVQLTEMDPDSWSGVTIREGDAIAIVLNPTHPATRQANTLVHEWAHIELRHKPNRVDRSEQGLLLLTDYPAEIEEEADWLAGAVLLPREGLLHHRTTGLSVQSIANHYGVSEQLVNWRLRMTGIERQMRNRF